MDNGLKDFILAIVTQEIDKVHGGGCPVFVANSSEQQERMSLLLARILGGNVHDLENGVFFIVRH
ncbi:MAG: hypothetical protein U9N81_11860 [Bacillota bacterium]|nr:hypothetical protein [Bacillota bacterium]